MKHTFNIAVGDMFAGRFAVEAIVGCGGMGEVYRARDTRLNRLVALKLIGSENPNPEWRRRLAREARVVAGLSHRNICSLYDFDKDGDRDYLVLEYLEGETLSARLARGALPNADWKRAALEITTAMAYSHQHGVIHRDLKPGNIMLTKDGVKLLDFGLAKDLTSFRSVTESGRASEHTMETEDGRIMGTVAYMSPEQAEGRPIDARTDIFSFGCVLYEMVSGKAAFRGDSAVSILAAIIYKAPEPLNALAPSVPKAVLSVVDSCLRKRPQERFQSMEAVSQALEQVLVTDAAETAEHPVRLPKLGPTQVTDDRPLQGWRQRSFFLSTSLKTLLVVTAVAVLIFVGARTWWHLRSSSDRASDSVVVLPFKNVQKDPAIEYLADGLSESLTNALSRVPTLRVIARATAFTYKDRNHDPLEIGKALRVRSIIDGNVLQQRGVLRVQADLVDAATGTEKWGQQYEGKLDEALHIQDGLVRNIGEHLGSGLAGSNRSELSWHPTHNPDAYQLYLKARYALNQYTPTDLKKSIQYFWNAIELDPAYALAYSGMADAYSSLSGLYMKPSEAMLRAKSAVAQAIELDPALAAAHTSSGIIEGWYNFSWPAAERQFRRALELNPHDAAAHFWLGWTLTSQGNVADGIAEGKLAHELDPLSPFVETGLGQMYFLSRDYAAAVTQLRNVVEWNGAFSAGHLWLGVAYLYTNEYDLAVKELETARKSDPAWPQPIAYLAYALVRRGEKTAAGTLLNQLRSIKKERYVSDYLFAITSLGLGAKGEVTGYLESAYRDRDDMLSWLKQDALLDPVRSNPRFVALLRRCGF